MVNMTMAPLPYGSPASRPPGKSSIVARLLPKLASMDMTAEVLESDAVRRILTPEASYSNEDAAVLPDLGLHGARLLAHGVNVIIDATASRPGLSSLPAR